jgi:hypothetical protein
MIRPAAEWAAYYLSIEKNTKPIAEPIDIGKRKPVMYRQS